MSGYNRVINFDFLLKGGSYFTTRTKRYPCFQVLVISAVLTNISWYESFTSGSVICQKAIAGS